jgi:hypothetical protein
VRLPDREGTQLLGVFHVLKIGEHLSALVHGIGWQVFVELLVP